MLYRYCPDLDGDGYEWAYGDGAAAGLIPTNDGETCVFVATTPERMRELRRAGTEACLQRPARRRRTRCSPNGSEPGRSAGRLHGWAGLPGFVRRSWGPGWALVGDAGYFKDPITTHGMTDALRDAELLADAILARLDGVPEPVALRGVPDAPGTGCRARSSRSPRRSPRYDWDTARVQELLRRSARR